MKKDPFTGVLASRLHSAITSAEVEKALSGVGFWTTFASNERRVDADH